MKHNTKRRPLPKGKYQSRKTLYGRISDCLNSGKAEDYDNMLGYLEKCKDFSELRNIITDIIRDYLFRFRSELYLPTKKQQFENLFKK